jgi:ABC-type multidrug transport system ATPase subunit
VGHLIKLQDFFFSYDTESCSAWKLNVPTFALSIGDIAVISGDNMSGKSTFLNLLAGLVPIDERHANIFGPSSIELSQDNLAVMSVILSSDDKMFPELSVRENIEIASRSIPFASLSSTVSKARALLHESGVIEDDMLNMPLGSLSSGGRALVKLARAHVSECPVIIVDEISSFLDDVRAKYFLDAAIKLTHNGHCLVIVSHSERDRKILLREENSSSFHISRSENVSMMRRLEE